MYVRYACPNCQAQAGVRLTPEMKELSCPHCDWERPLPDDPAERQHPQKCLLCGCRDLWRQKDFPQRLGVLFVAVGAVMSTIAYAYHHPFWSLGILMFFAALDLLLFVVMPDVLVCYRCGTRYRQFDPAGPTGYFDLEVAEKYRQEAIRREQARQVTPPPAPADKQEPAA